MIKKLIIIFLLLVSNLTNANITITGISCLNMIVINNEVVVCVRSFEDQKKDILLTPDNADFIESLYYVLLLRVPDTPGETYWLNLLNTNKFTRVQIFDFFVNSGEYKNLHP